MRTQKKQILDKLAVFFEENGGFMSEQEYKKAGVVPVRLVHIRRYVGSWARLKKFMETHYNNLEEAAVEKVTDAPIGETPNPLITLSKGTNSGEETE